MGSTPVQEKTASITQAVQSIFKSLEVLEGYIRQIVLHHEHTAPHDYHEGEFVISAALYINGEEDQQPRVEGLIALASRMPEQLTYKFISEENNPWSLECPISVLDFLTPTRHPWAIAWREECRNFQLNREPFKRMAS